MTDPVRTGEKEEIISQGLQINPVRTGLQLIENPAHAGLMNS